MDLDFSGALSDLASAGLVHHVEPTPPLPAPRAMVFVHLLPCPFSDIPFIPCQ
ncbi:hypothetical protein PGTUg99_037504 [Puccinia graminis f. sp. tritici]|uniref:Uncharacterized protein n=1 Tax=Puccinia graminis f. sp. tritici TaxID=56615 RepID=A0A5B0SP60_PUCGR|nr:hypothetical protein PGTUg99_037504 [Puccinia graminis f. sp. tritici]